MTGLVAAGLEQVHCHHQDEDHKEHQRKQRIDLRLDRLFDIVVDLDRERDEARAGDKVGND